MSDREHRDETLRETFLDSTAMPPGDACPPAERIWDSAAERLDARANEDVVLHLADCASCSTSWRLARELAEGEGEPRARRGPRTWWTLAAAAVLVIAAGFVYRWVLDEPMPEPAYRVQEGDWLRSEVPGGVPLAREDCVLRWTAGPEGTTYDITVSSEDLEILERRFGLHRPEHRVDPAVLETVPPGGSILWRVTADLADGRRVLSGTVATPLE